MIVVGEHDNVADLNLRIQSLCTVEHSGDDLLECLGGPQEQAPLDRSAGDLYEGTALGNKA
ncbi:MAG: hypothetical protein AAGD01_05815 [Acidobacteriota bacterium]